jgi:hypothetical protein
MRALLRHLWGFDEVGVLTGREATARALDTQFHRFLVASRRAEDVVLFYYTGHGSFYPDESGDEPDGYDECLVSAEGLALLDDTLGRWVDEIPARQITVVFDTCHAGTALRGPEEAEDPLPVDWPLPTKAVAPPGQAYAGREPPAAPRAARHDPWRRASDGRPKGQPHYVFLGACRPGEEASGETPPGYPPPLSLFTPYLCAALQEATPATTWQEVTKAVARRVYRVNPLQHPVGEGPLARTVFESLAPERVRRTASARPCPAPGVVAAVGGVAGADRVASFAPSPPPLPPPQVFAVDGREAGVWPGFTAAEQSGVRGEVYPAADQPPAGTLRLTGEVRWQEDRLLARAEVVTGHVARGNVVRLVRQPCPAPPLRVRVSPVHSLFGWPATLRDDLPFATAAADGQAWDVWLAGCRQEGVFYRKTLLRHACRWLEAHTRSGLRYEGSGEDLRRDWRTRLSVLQAQRHALALHNPAPPFPTELWIEGTVGEPPLPAAGPPAAIHWRVGAAAYVALLVLWPDGTHQVFHLAPIGRSQRAEGGRTYTSSLDPPHESDEPLSAVVQLLATRAPLDLQDLAGVAPFETGPRLRESLQEAAGAADAPDLIACDRWAEASLILELR